MNNQLSESLLFMPDISGFTKFINKTEIEHSSHIISELLEIIIAENKLGLEIAEIEGDAILFYKKASNPSAEEVFQQCKRMFLAFHSHLKKYETQRICQCGACSSAMELSLKFITHYGEVMFRDISGRLQLMGPEVTTIHKLLKNDVESDDYLLLSSSFLGDDNFSDIEDVHFISGHSNYEGVGDVDYSYGKLDKLKKAIPAPPPIEDSLKRVKNPLKVSMEISAPMTLVHSIIIDNNERMNWRTDNEIRYDEKKVERIGLGHECLVDQGILDITVKANLVEPDRMVYIEHADPIPGKTPEIEEMFEIKRISEKSCHLNVEMHIQSAFKALIFKLLFRKKHYRTILNLKKLCESTYIKGQDDSAFELK